VFSQLVATTYLKATAEVCILTNKYPVTQPGDSIYPAVPLMILGNGISDGSTGVQVPAVSD
jgi:hypothetical protein